MQLMLIILKKVDDRMASKKFLFLLSVLTIIGTNTLYTSQVPTETSNTGSEDPRPIPATTTHAAALTHTNQLARLYSPLSCMSRSQSLATIYSDQEDADIDENDDDQASQLLKLSLSQLLLLSERPPYHSTPQLTLAQFSKTPVLYSPKYQIIASTSDHHAPPQSNIVVTHVGRFTITDSQTPSPALITPQTQDKPQSPLPCASTNPTHYTALQSCASAAHLAMSDQRPKQITTGPVRKNTWPSH